MVVIPFIFLMLATAEYGLFYLAGVTLENATTDAARQIRTGEAQAKTGADTVTATMFKKMVCNQMGWLRNECEGNISVDARVYTTFAAASDPVVSSGTGAFDTAKLKFEMGGPRDIILVTTFYKWKLASNMLSGGLSSSFFGAGFGRLTGRAVFRNEPFA